MSFSSPLFLFLFLPVTLILYFIVRGRLKVFMALAASVLFYVWGNPIYFLPIVGLIALNYWLGRRIESQRGKGNRSRNILLVSVILNVALLVFFKLFANLGADLLTRWGRPNDASLFGFPLGLSYITFQVISYLVDVHTEKCPGEKNFFNFALYILVFPRIIAGPITAYRDIRDQLAQPKTTVTDAAAGIRRFIVGLAKKVLIADQIARVVDPVFRLSTPALDPASAWLAIIAYALQLFFDFSGYTDMAIGLGRAMGFTFAENFNYPYMAKSLSDFWRRWHMSLVGWFREYVFLRLEFARRKSRFLRQQTNILIVFILTGLWHGFSFTFLIWGALHGLVLGIEATRFGRWLKKIPAPVQHVYTLFIVLIGWVFFRSPNVPYAFSYLTSMFIPSFSKPLLADISPIAASAWISLAVGVVLCFPVSAFISKILAPQPRALPSKSGIALTAVREGLCILLFVVSLLFALGSTYQPYIYMRF
jgi:alginate O-acetyltransferase complex protein AlgI